MKRNDYRDYRILLSRLNEEDGGGWLAEVPELMGCISDGATQEEALSNVQEAIRDWIAAAKEKGGRIPKPASHEDASFSGKFTLRLPRSLHKYLSERAESEGVSLNQMILAMIGFSAGSSSPSLLPWEQSIDRENLERIPGLWRKERALYEVSEHEGSRDWTLISKLPTSRRVN